MGLKELFTNPWFYGTCIGIVLFIIYMNLLGKAFRTYQFNPRHPAKAAVMSILFAPVTVTYSVIHAVFSLLAFMLIAILHCFEKNEVIKLVVELLHCFIIRPYAMVERNIREASVLNMLQDMNIFEEEKDEITDLSKIKNIQAFVSGICDLAVLKKSNKVIKEAIRSFTVYMCNDLSPLEWNRMFFQKLVKGEIEE